MLDFSVDSGAKVTVPNNQDLPKDLDIFFRNEREFLPPGKNFNDLTPEELEELKNKYRFDYLRPGIYQGITAITGTGRGNML